jgi:hypothetical protein
MRNLLSLAVVLSLFGAPMIVGCDRELSDKESVKVKDDGTVVKHKEQVTEKADGTVVKEEKHDVQHP